MNKQIWVLNTGLSRPFLSVNCWQRDGGYVLNAHSHSFWQIILVTKGTLQITTDFGQDTLCAGWMHILPPGMEHSLFSSGGYVQLGMDLAAEGEVDRLILLLEDTVSKPVSFFLPQGLHVCDRVLEDQRRGTFFSHTRMLHLLEGLLLEGIAVRESGDLGLFEERLLSCLQENLHRQLRLEEIAAAFSVSIPHLERLCRRSFHNGVIAQLQKLRLEKAQQLLLSTDLPIKEIGIAVGYSNPSQFSVFFKHAAGLSPAAFRKNGKWKD